MLQVKTNIQVTPRLQRANWHRPLASIVITHFNYSSYIEDALLSLLDQTHEHWECIVVDDCSEASHREQLTQIVTNINCDKIKILSLDENIGQIPAFFAGLDSSSGEFVCLLDPDDRYAETFLEESINAHLNNSVVCPIVCTDQYMLTEQGVITATHATHKLKQQLERVGDACLINDDHCPLLYFHAETRGWPWTSTSSLMFRRSAVKYIRPNKKLSYKRAGDAYLASGTHLLGGTLFLTKPLVYRTLHDNNSWITQELFSSFQDKRRTDAPQWVDQCKKDVQEALNENNAPKISKWWPNAGRNPHQKQAQKHVQPPPVIIKDKRLLTKWKRSLNKRLVKLCSLIGIRRKYG